MDGCLDCWLDIWIGDWVIGCLVGWLVGWLVVLGYWLDGRVVGGWLIVRVVGNSRLTSWLIVSSRRERWLVGRKVDRLVGWSAD